MDDPDAQRALPKPLLDDGLLAAVYLHGQPVHGRLEDGHDAGHGHGPSAPFELIAGHSVGVQRGGVRDGPGTAGIARVLRETGIDRGLHRGATGLRVESVRTRGLGLGPRRRGIRERGEHDTTRTLNPGERADARHRTAARVVYAVCRGGRRVYAVAVGFVAAAVPPSTNSPIKPVAPPPSSLYDAGKTMPCSRVG